MNDVVELPLHKHKRPHRELIRRYKAHWANKDYRWATVGAFLMFTASMMVSLLAGHFAKTHASNFASDIILSNTPVVNVSAFFMIGTVLFVVMTAMIAFAHPRRVPYTLLALALFYFIRAAFVTMTHIAPFPERATTNFATTIRSNFFGSDLFFSGHTGAPFLMALIFWRSREMRYLFLAWSVFFAVVVLLGHLHYTIDVASAYFITYTIFCIAEVFFPEYRELFYSDLSEEELEQEIHV